MQNAVKSKLDPGVIGCVTSVLLIVSFFLTKLFADNHSMAAFNTILIIAAMCCEVHLVRSTSSFLGCHVWNSVPLLCLLIIPIFNLLVVAFQLCGVSFSDFFSRYIFVLFQIILSLPVFNCVYFGTVFPLTKKDAYLKICNIVLFAVSGLYVVFRLTDKVVIPFLQENAHMIPQWIRNAVSYSSDLSLIAYMISFICFARIFVLIRNEKEQKDRTTL